jgi:hypothetical protein
MVSRCALVARFACALALAPAALANVTILGQPGSYATIQAAVNAAVDGDVLIVDAGTYAGFTIDGKGIAIVASPGSSICSQRPARSQRDRRSRGAPERRSDHRAGHASHAGRAEDRPRARVTPRSGAGLHLPRRVALVFLQLVGSVPLGTRRAPRRIARASIFHAVHAAQRRLAKFIAGEDMCTRAASLRRPALHDRPLRLHGPRWNGHERNNPTGGKGGRGCASADFGVVLSGGAPGRERRRRRPIGCSISGDGGDALV